MQLEVKIAILGIIGTLLGTVIGWMLNNVSKTGKLSVFISEWTDTFKYNKEGYIVLSTTMEQTQYYTYNLEMDLYNSSADTKIMRNIKIIFLNGKRVIKTDVPQDDATKVNRQHFTSYYDVGPINIPPKTVLKYTLLNSFNKDGMKFIWETSSIALCYTDEKRRVKTVPIKKENYMTYFERHTQESS